MPASRVVACIALLIGVVLAMLLPAFGRSAEAHAALVRANPENNAQITRVPARVTLNFSEPLERDLTKIEVFDADDNRVDEDDLAFSDQDRAFASVGLPSLEPGLYFVRWSNVSTVDGHGLSGSYPFVVLNADGSFPEGVSLDDVSSSTGGQGLLPRNIDSALKWISMLSISIIAGGAFFVLVVARPAAVFLEEEPYQEATDASERWIVNLAHVLLPAAFIAAAFLILLVWSRFETSTSILQYVTDVRAGQFRGLQLLLIIVALVGADMVFLARKQNWRTAGLVVLLAATIGALFTFSMVSHSAGGTGRYWSIASDFVHIVASSAWLGALVMLLLAIRWKPAWPDSQRYLYLANASDRFSIVAGISVVAVLSTGIFNGLVELGEWDWFVDTTYGRVLLAKLIMISPLLAVAGFNAFILKPRLVASIDRAYQAGIADAEPDAGRDAQVARSHRWLMYSVAVEVVLVIAVFASVAVLTQTSTAQGEIAQEEAAAAAGADFEQVADKDDVKMTLLVSPNKVGLNEYTLIVTDASGQPLTTVTQARLRFSYDNPDIDLGTSELLLTRSGDGEFRGGGAYFSQPGNWRVEAGIRRSDGDDVAHLYVLPVTRPTTGATTDDGGAWELPFTAFTWNEVAGAFLALAGAVIIVYRKQLRWLQQTSYRAGITAATVMLLAGAVLVFGVDTHTQAQDPTEGNPVAPTTDSVERGRMLFQQNCVQCHGVDGRGDGPDAASLNPQPTDFRLHLPLHTDPQFFNFIAEGYSGSAMPAFRDAFSDDDIWNLVNYLRSAFSDAPSQ